MSTDLYVRTSRLGDWRGGEGVGRQLLSRTGGRNGECE